MLLLLLQHVFLLLILSRLSWSVTCATGLVASRLSALLLILLTTTLVPVGDPLGNRTCGGRGGRGVRLWLSHLYGRSYLLSPGFSSRAFILAIL